MDASARYIGLATGLRHLENIKALGLRPRAFICFSASGNPGQTLALVFDVLRKTVEKHETRVLNIHLCFSFGND